MIENYFLLFFQKILKKVDGKFLLNKFEILRTEMNESKVKMNSK